MSAPAAVYLFLFEGNMLKSHVNVPRHTEPFSLWNLPHKGCHHKPFLDTFKKSHHSIRCGFNTSHMSPLSPTPMHPPYNRGFILHWKKSHTTGWGPSKGK